MRGKAKKHIEIIVDPGITPAYAGKRQFRKQSDCHGQDHPRLCGEKKPLLSRVAFYAGSPPPMRGKELCTKLRILR